MARKDQMSLFDAGSDISSPPSDKAEFEKMEAAALANRAQTIATISTVSSLVAHSSTPPFSLIDPYSAGLMAIGHVIDSLKLLDIEDSNLTVQGLVERVAADLERQFQALKNEKSIEELPWRSEVEGWARGIVDKLLCKKGMGKATDRLFSTENDSYYDFHHSLLEEKEDIGGKGRIYVKPTTACLTLYLGTLTQSIGDAQAAFAAVIQRQIRRGEYQAALQSALEHQRVTKQYCIEIQKFKRKILSDAEHQGWSADVLPLIKKTQDDVEDAMRGVTELDLHLDESFEMLPRDKQAMAEKVQNVIRQSRTAYRELEATLIELPLLYHRCIESQGFASRHIPLPSMRDDVFKPFFFEITDRDAFSAACDALIWGCLAPAPVALLDPVAATEVLLRPTASEEVRDESEGLECVDEEEAPFLIFDEETRRKARETLVEAERAAADSPVRLSTLVTDLCREGFHEEAACVALMVTSAWTHRKPVAGSLTPARNYQSFACAACRGDDYLLSNIEAAP